MKTQNHRKTDKILQSRSQSSRIFSLNNQWFFATREGENIGPFADKFLTQKAVDRFTSSITSYDVKYPESIHYAKTDHWGFVKYK